MRGIAVLLVAIGLLQMVGDVADVAVLKGLGAASGASPAPKVFSAVGGYETFSTRFFLEWTDAAGAAHSLELTPAVAARLAGPYNRRNVYGAAIAYGPVLATNPRTRPLLRAVMRYALCGDAPLLAELGIDAAAAAGRVRLRFVPLPGTDMSGLPRSLEPDCR